MKKRVISLLLITLMTATLCLSAVGCDGKNDDGSKDALSTGDEGFFGLELPEDVDYSGKTVRVLTTATAQGIGTHQIQPESNSMYSSENASAVLNTAAECTRLVEEQLGITVEEEVIYTWSRYGGDMYKKMQQDALSGGGDYLIAMPCTIEAGMLSIEGLLYDLNKVPNIDLSREWWCQAFNEAVTVDGKCYFAIGDIGTVNKDATFFVAFNKKMVEANGIAESYGYDSLYAMVDDMAWTQDVMYEMAKSVYQDLNGNNICDAGDVNGLAGQDGAIYNMLTGADEKIVDLDEDGFPMLAVNNERAIKVINDAQEYFKDPQSGFISANDYFGQSQVPVADVIVPEFKADRLLFFMDAILNLDNIRDMESDFGVLPCPMYDDDQDNYVSQIGCWSANCIVVPSYVQESDLELAGLFIEALSAVSHAKLTPVYYEQTLQYQIARDDDSMRMLDIIFATRTCELAEIYNLDVFRTVQDMLKAQQGTFVSALDAVEEKTEARLEEIVESYKNNG